ncbi:hypothetical protein CLU79DRAFT_690075, partial [Phycomyces nitens]
DLSIKIILQSLNIINKLTMSINEAPSDTYNAASTTFSDGTECDVLYMPESNMFSNFPPIIIEIQQVVNIDLMDRAIQYCLNVRRKYKVYHVLLIFCVQKISSMAYLQKFTSHSKWP